MKRNITPFRSEISRFSRGTSLRQAACGRCRVPSRTGQESGTGLWPTAVFTWATWATNCQQRLQQGSGL